MTANARSTFTLRGVQRTLGLSRAVLSGLIGAGFVTPVRGPRNEHRFTFQDLMLLRTAHSLHRSKISPKKILRSLAILRGKLPAELPLTGLRITAVGAAVVVRGRDGTQDAASGQLLLDFDVADDAKGIAFLDRTGLPTALDAKAHFKLGESLEADDPKAAEHAYRKALELDPACADAYVNLGAMLCESSHWTEALKLFDEAIVRCPDAALIRFNRAVALEDLDRTEDAVACYEDSLLLDPGLADAHFNIARLQERLGDERSALRHFNAYRRLDP